METTNDDPSKIATGGIKYDAGKPCVFQGVVGYFPRAMIEVAKVSTFGANKYAWGGWADVSDGFNRYKNAQYRHALYRHLDGEIDSDSKLLHLAHEAWNAMASLELYLRDRPE